MDPILQCILKKKNDLAIGLISDSFMNATSCLDTAASLNQKDIVLALLKYTKVNCSGFLMEELLDKKYFEIAKIFVDKKRLWGSAARIFLDGSSEIQYTNQKEFVDWMKSKID